MPPFDGPALDPYTRLLASIADAVGNTRRSMHSVTLIMIAAGVLSTASMLLLLTSIVWGPALWLLCCAWMASSAWVLAASWNKRLYDYLCRAWAISKAKLASLTKASASPSRTRAAMTDHRFLRTIFDSLPGVDANLAFHMLQMSPPKDHQQHMGSTDESADTLRRCVGMTPVFACD